MIEFLGWVLRRVGFRNAATILLLLIALASFAYGLDGLIGGVDGELVLLIGLAGTAVGWLLARSPLPASLAALIAGILGAEIVLVRVGQLGGRIAGVFVEAVRFAGALLAWCFSGRAPHDRQPTVDGLYKTASELLAAAATVLARGREWLAGLATGHGTFDPVGAALAWTALVMLICLWAGWTIGRRKQPFQATLPLMALLAATLVYTGAGAVSLLFLLGSTLLLMVLVGQAAREERWQAEGTDFSEEIRSDLAITTVPLCFVLVLLSAIVPSFSIREIVQSAQRFMREDAGDAAGIPGSLGLQAAPAPTTVFDTVFSPGLPNEHLVGMSPESSNRVIMQIRTDDLKPAAPGAVTPPRYYWRSETYDRYSGRGWYTSWTDIQERKSDEPASQVQGFAGHFVYQDVTFLGKPPGPLYTAGQPVAVDRDYQIALRSASDIFGVNIKAVSYRAESWIVTPDEAALERAGADYPDWVMRNYLELPPTVPSRVLALARDLTATGRTPYDRARAIELYLRAFPYTLDVPRPPSGRDVADYFLFDLKRGYCDYYATAMVVLARGAGLPARLVVGYSSGRYDAANARFDVTAANAHSWVEVYFPGYGWVEFEPTGGRAEIDREQEASRVYPPPRIPTGDSAGAVPPPGQSRTAWIAWLVALFALAFFVTGLLAFDDWRLRRLPPDGTIAAVYGRMTGASRALRAPAGSASTPYQVTAALAARLEELSAPRRSSGKPGRDRPGEDDRERARARLLGEIKYRLAGLADLYLESTYSARRADAMSQSRALQLWGQLRPALWRARLRQLIRRR